MIRELDVVALTRDLPDYGLQTGDIGAVVLVHRDQAGYEVEFVTLTGDTIAVATVPADAVRPVGPREIAHARLVS